MIKIIETEKTDIFFGFLFTFWCLVLPWSIAGMQIILVLLVVSSLVYSLIKKRSPIKYHPFYLFPLSYLLAHLITIFFTDNWLQAIRAVFHNDWMILTIPFIISLPVSPFWRKRAFKVLLISALIAGVYGIIQFFVGVEFIRGKSLAKLGDFYRAVGGYSGFFAFAGNQLFVFGIAISFLVLAKRWKHTKIFYLLSAIIIFFSIIASLTRSAWLASIVVLLLSTLIINRRYFIYVAGLLVLGGILMFFLFPDIQNRFMSIFDPSKNEARLNLWKTSWNIFKHNPIFGIGHGFFNEYFEIYKVPGYYDAKTHAHNDYLNVAVLNGVIGLLTWLGMWLSWFYFSYRTYLHKILIEADKQIVLGAILGVAGILFAALFQCYYTDLENNIFWWFIAATSMQIVIQNTKN